MKVCFAGTPDFAVPILAAIFRSRHRVALVVTQPDRPAGRGQKSYPPPVKEFVLQHGLPVIQPESINLPEAVETLRALEPDALVVAAYGKRLTPRVLRIPRLGCYNVHASLLPRYRGASPIAHAILNGERETGVTIQRMAPEIDAGAIVAQRAIPIGDEETTGELYDRLAALSAEMIVQTLDAIEAGTVVERPQDPELATPAPKLGKEDGLVPWHQDSRTVCDFVRAMTPWPGAFSWLRTGDGKERGRVILLSVRPTEDKDLHPFAGVVLSADRDLVVAAGKGAVSVRRLQPEGKRPMEAAAFLRGHGLKPGDRFYGR